METRGLTEAVHLVRSMADQLEAVVVDQGSEVLTLREASAESGYSADHLGRMIRAGKVPNAGRRGAPRVRRSDLPTKTASLTRVGPVSTLEGSKAAVVRSIANQGS